MPLRRFAALWLLCVLPVLSSPDPAEEPLDASLKKIVDVYSVLESQAADRVPPDKAFYEGAIPGMLRRLDPHSVFFDPGQFQQLKELEKSTRKGFGTIVSLLPGRVTILQVMPNTPSARSGLSPGDEILAVNGIALNRLEVEQLAQLLGETRQRQARIDVRRPGNARLQQFMLTPEEVESPSVERVFELRPGVGYIRVGSFEAQTGKQVHDAIEIARRQQAQGPGARPAQQSGGILPAALETAAQFLQPKQKILSVKGRKVETQDVDVPDQVTPYTFPVAIVVNAKSASASEIVAGAIQDHKRGAIVGEPTYGKGLVQSVYSLSRQTGLALTTAFYYTPGGRSIQRHLSGALDSATVRAPDSGTGGIQPDQVVHPESQNPLRAAIELSGSFASFATTYLHSNPQVTSGGSPPPASSTSSARSWFARIQPSISEWSREMDWIRFRLKQEVLNQALGVAKGDEVEVQRDPQVRAALPSLGIE